MGIKILLTSQVCGRDQVRGWCWHQVETAKWRFSFLLQGKGQADSPSLGAPNDLPCLPNIAAPRGSPFHLLLSQFLKSDSEWYLSRARLGWALGTQECLSLPYPRSSQSSWDDNCIAGWWHRHGFRQMGRNLWVRPVARRQCRPREKERSRGWEVESTGCKKSSRMHCTTWGLLSIFYNNCTWIVTFKNYI